ncbi:MAG: type II secretion system F family protein [Actinomycetota bacterium]|nr:type II secretion system F family protein [Actinomycetota bacterium]
MKAPAAGNTGIVLVIDQSASMRGAALTHAMAAARAIATQRTGKQELGVITFDSAPSLVLPMTSDPATINRALARTPWTGVGTGPLRALMAGLQQLAYAHITDGSVILLSDGAATGASKFTAQSVSAAALAQHARIFTVGLQDRSFAPGPMRQIARLGGGKFVLATGAQLPPAFARLATTPTQSYLLRYQSILPGSQHVAVTVHLDGVPSLLRLSYDAPALASSGTGSATTPSPPTTSNAGASATTPAGTKTSRTTTPGAQSGGASTTAPDASGLPLRSSWGIISFPSSNPHRATTGHAPKAGRAPLGTGTGSAPTSADPGPRWVPPSQHHSFWASSLAVVLIAGSCALLIGLATTVLFLRRPARRALQRRVGSFTLTSLADPTNAVLTTEAPGLVAQLFTRRRWWPAFAERVDSGRMKRSPLQLVKRTAVISVVAAVLLRIMLGSILPGLLAVIVAPFILRTLVARAARRQRSKFNEQLPSHLQDLAGAMRAGRSFVGGIAAMVDSATEPIRGEFDRALSDERLGKPLEDTLEAIGRRMEAKDMDQVALIASLNRQSGSNVAEALERVAESARERADLRREMKALTGQARMSAGVLTGMPPVLLLALTIMAPAYPRPFFHSTIGFVLLFFAAGLLVAAWMVMGKIVNPKM